MVKCPGCGSGMVFDPVSQKVKCEHCSTMLEPEVASTTMTVEDQGVFESVLYVCPQCGGEIVSDADTVATFCSYCGASVILESRVVQMVAPSHVIPFKIPKESCKNIYKGLLSKAIYAPSYMKSEEQINKVRGIYMPYWDYDFTKNGQIRLNGRKSYRRGDYVYTDHYVLSADISASYEGVSYDASSSFSDELSNSIAPFIVSDAKEFNPSYLSGFYADTADVSDEVYSNDARNIVKSDLQNYCRNIPEFRGYTIDSNNDVTIGLEMTSKEVDYYPVWFLANRHNDKISYAVINGQTGKVSADIPIDYTKYLIGTLILSVPIIVLLNMFLTLTPNTMAIIAIIFAAIIFFTVNGQCNLIYRRENNLNDKGMLSKHTAKTISAGMPMKQKGRIIVKPAIAALIDLIVVVVQPVYDYVYYIAIILSLVFVLISFYDVISGHNRLTMRKPQQFGVRGGDENASI